MSCNVKNRRKNRQRFKLKSVNATARPRLSVYRSNCHMYAQIIDDVAGKTLASASTVLKDAKAPKNGGNVAAAEWVGTLLAERAKAAGVEKVVFDRSGLLYHGRVKALAEAARAGGLQF
jgi:large subunit ribosomal protein L18